MGKKNKKKVDGKTKTAMKTEKKLTAKQKKQLQAIGEEDIEKVIAQIEQEEAQRQQVVEVSIDQPSRRVNFTLCAHPFKNELIMFGGEFCDGQKTVVYGELFFYNLTKKTWTLLKVPGAPPPRCAHQAVALPNNKGELWIFGGEFSSPSESQFYHYRDLWVYHIEDRKWEKITAPGGPSPRSGHRMTYAKRQLFIFGGFHDNLRDFKYFNDFYIFDLTSYKWTKIDLTGDIPPPRSGSILLPTPDYKIIVFGGYSKEKVKKNIEKGLVHTDMFLLSQDKHDTKSEKWKALLVRQSGIKFSPRCSSTAILVQPNTAYIFGGVYDDAENEEELNGTFFNDLLSLDIEKYQWKNVYLMGKKEKKKKADKIDDDNGQMEITTETEPAAVTVIDDGVFTMTIGSGATTNAAHSNIEDSKVDVFMPPPRINPGLTLKNNILYLYGGLYEDGDHQYTLNDFYSLDLHKLNEWNTIIENDISSQVWMNTDSSSGESGEDSDSSDSSGEEMEDGT